MTDPHPFALEPILLENLQNRVWNLEDFVLEVNGLLSALLPSTTEDARQREDFSVRLLRHYASIGLLDESERVGREARYHYRHLLQILCLRRLQREGWNSRAIAGFTSRENSELETFLLGYLAPPLEPETDLGHTSGSISGSTSQTPEQDSKLDSSALEHTLKPQITPKKRTSPVLTPSAASVASVASAAPISTPNAAQHNALEFLQGLRSRSAAAPPQQMPAPAPLPQFLLHDPPLPPEQWRRIEIAPGLELNISDRFRKARTSADRSRLLQALEIALDSK